MTSTSKKYDFTGKVALVTGSSAGIGAAIALQFAEYGARVTITGRNADNLRAIGGQIESETGHSPLQLVGDMTDVEFVPKLITETVATYGRLDILVNNAGWATAHGTLSSPKLMESFDHIFALNVRSVVQLTQLAVPHLEATKGNVINVSSVAAVKPTYLVYSSSKAALDMVTKCSALELGPKGIRVNSINPGPVYTTIDRALGLKPGEFEAFLHQKYLPLTALNRIGHPTEVANLASFLASDDARNMTGGIYLTDGGRSIK